MKWFACAIALGAVLQFFSNAWAQPASSDITVPAKEKLAPIARTENLTERQAMIRIEDAGYSSVSTLKKDKDGVWRGKGVKRGATQNVSVDAQGNVKAEE